MTERHQAPLEPEWLRWARELQAIAQIGLTYATENHFDAVGFFAEHDLPALSLGRVTPAQVRRLFEHHLHPEWPTDLD